MPIFLWAYFFTVPAEDAVILYEYSKNLAERGLITYGGSQIPIEGATDFLWMLLIAIMKTIGLSEFASALVLNFFGIFLILNLFNKSKVRLWIIFTILLTPFFYASLNGLSAIFFVALHLIVLKLFFTKNRWLYAAVFILCLIPKCQTS